MSQIRYIFACIFGFYFICVEAYPIISETNDEAVNAFLGLNSFYITILVVLVLSASFLAGCLCCKQKKGFQEFTPRARNNARGNIEFSNPLSTVNTQSEITLFPPSGSTPITFDPLPPLTPKHQQQVPVPNPRPAAFTDALTKGISVQAWFQEPQSNFPRQQLHYLRECGRGWFGRVVEGEARGILPNGRTSRVIVRILREGATESEQKFFLHEAKPYVELSHPNILRLLGRCLENDPFLLLFEACNGGDLKSWLTQNVASRETLMQQGITMRMAADIASGLAHMNHHGFVHTDLAARNVLVTSDLRIKVGDYGTSIENFKDDYYCFGEVALPIRWCAPETLLCTDTTIETKEVTAPANVWSFGIVLWEICEFGKLPYTDLSDDQVIVRVLGSEKVRLPEPSFPSPFKNHLYYLMQLCWRSQKERPSISHILSMLNHLLTSKIKTQNDMDDFERRWENMKPNSVPKTDNHTPTMSEDRVKSDNDSGVVLDNKTSAFAGSEMDLSSKKLLAESSSSMTISPQLSVTSSSGGEFFSQTSSPVKLRSPSLQNLQGSLEDINEAVSCSEQRQGLDLWLQNIEIKNEKDARLVSGVYKAINDLDNALSLEKTSSSNESSCYDSPSSNRKSPPITNLNPVPDFKLGPFVNNNFHMDRRLKFQPDSFQDDSFIMKRTGDSSGTDTEDEIWRRRIERGEFSEKVKEKSKSIADLMILTHIDNSDGSESDSLPSFSFNKMVRQNTKTNALANSIGFGSDICIYSSLSAEQPDSDLKKFQNALKKKDMNDPSLNFLRRDSLSYFINNPNFKFSDSSSNSSSNFHQTDHFLEIRASEKTNNSPKITVKNDDVISTTLLKSTPEIYVSSCIDNEESPPDESSISLSFKPKKFKFVFKPEPETSNPPTGTNTAKNLKTKNSPDILNNIKQSLESTNNLDSAVVTNSIVIVDNIKISEKYEQNFEDRDSRPTLAEKSNIAVICDSSEHNSIYNGKGVSETCQQIFKESKSDPNLSNKFDLTVICDPSENKTSDNVVNYERTLKNYKSDPSLSTSQTCPLLEGKNDGKKNSENSDNNISQWNCKKKKDCERKMFNFELGDSGIIIDEPSENSQFILPISCKSNLESSVILGSCEDFTLDLYKGLTTCMGAELNAPQENKKETVLEWNRKNKLNEEHLQTSNQDVKNVLDENCDRIFIETVDNSDSFVPENDKGGYAYDRFCEEHSDDTYIDSGKSSDVLDDENYELKPYTSYSNLADYSYQSQESKVGEDCSSEPEFRLNTAVLHSNNLSRSVHTSSEDLDALKLLTPDDEKSSDTGFRDKSSPSESCDDMYNDKYNLEDIENELEDIHPPSCIEYPNYFQKIENESGNFSENKRPSDNNSVFPCFGESGLKKDGNTNYSEEYFKSKRNWQQIKPDENTINCFFNNKNFESIPELIHEKDSSGDCYPITNDKERCVDRHEKEEMLPPPSYEECEHLNTADFQMAVLKQESRQLEHPIAINREQDALNFLGTDAEDNYCQGQELFERCDSNSSIDSGDEGHHVTVCEGGTGGWYLHSRLPDNETLQNNWLPQSISDDDNRNEMVSEEYLMAIRNELNEKLLKMHLPGLSSEKEEEEELTDDLIICDDSEPKMRSRKGQDIFIQYNNLPEYLSPIAEEDENGYSSISSSCSNSSNSSETLSLNDNEKEVIGNKIASPGNEENKRECDEIIEINTETNEIRMLESPRPGSQLSASHSEDLTTEQLECIDQSSDYSVDSISPVTGSPSVTNTNALTFSSLNENLSQVFHSPNSTQSDRTFADDKTICSEPNEDCETDVEEVDEDLSSPRKESEVNTCSEPNEDRETDVKEVAEGLSSPRKEPEVKAICSESNEDCKTDVKKVAEGLSSSRKESEVKTMCSESNEDCKTDVKEVEESGVIHNPNKTPVDAENHQAEVMKNMNDLLLKPSILQSNSVEISDSPQNHQSDDWLKSVLLSSQKNLLQKPVVDSFEASNWPKTDTLTPSAPECAKTSEMSVDGFSVNNTIHDHTVNRDISDAVNSHSVENNGVECNTSQSPSTSPLMNKNQVHLKSTLAFEIPIGNDLSSNNCCDASLVGNNTDIDTNGDSLEIYKNYCRKKFKITKVDENMKPILHHDSINKPSESWKNNHKTPMTDEELNRRLNEINKEAQGRLEINVPTNEVSVPMPSPSEQNSISVPSSWPVSPQLFDLNLEKLGLTEIDANDDQMMSTSFIDSNSAENSEAEENLDSDTNCNERDFSEKKSKPAFDDGDFWCESTEFNVPLNRIAEENEDENENDDDYDDEDDEDTADFVPSSWNSQATPNKSVLKSPETRSEQKKNVSFKRQSYHCVYEYPREELSDSEEEANHSRFSSVINFDFSEYTDWEMGLTDDGSSSETPQDSETETVKPTEKHDVYALTPIDKDFSFNSSLEDDEFFISSSTRPFKNDQGSLNCQFFPGKSYLEENFKPLAADINEENNFEKI